LFTENLSECLLIFDDVLNNGFDGDQFITGLASHLRNLLVGKDAQTLKLLEVSEGISQRYLKQSKETSVSFLLSALNIANQCDLNYRNSKNQRLLVELALIKMCHIAAAISISEGVIINGSPSSEDGTKKKTEARNADAPNPEPIIPTLTAPAEERIAVSKEKIAQVVEEEHETAPPIQEIETQKPEIKIPSNSTSLIAASSIIPNLNELDNSISREEEQKPSYISGDSRQEYTADTFLKVWTAYANKSKQYGKINLFTIMTSAQPTLLEAFKVELVLESKLQETQLHAEKIDLLNFIRIELQNYGIELETRIAEQSTKKILYTSSDKYKHMAEKNPKLEDFKKLFNLDLDY
jgi:DNA polymerase-3 subunit gamma/tau